MSSTLDTQLAERVRALDFAGWRAGVAAIGGCAQPIRLAGAWQAQTPDGKVLAHRGGNIMVPCGNRRESVCPACSDRYSADAFHVVRAGLAGGHKGVPESVTGKPRAFVTLTAPSFGAVHNQRVSARGRRMPCACGTVHQLDDPRLGSPRDPEGYDYVGAVLWQAHAGMLWHRFVIALRRKLAHAAGLRVREFAAHARLSYAKVAEFQRRGLVHFHAVIRVDGPTGPHDPTPDWVTAELLEAAVYAAAASVTVTTARPDGERLVLGWGDQVDVRHIRPAAVGQVEDEHGQISEARLAGYIAKYATKGTGATEAVDRPVRSELAIEHLSVSEHHRRIVRTCWELGGLADYRDLNLRQWAHMLGFRGHFLTKSKAYSTTFTAIRGERRAHRLAEVLDQLGLEPSGVVVVNAWWWAGTGYRSVAERELALGIAERLRSARQRKYRGETA